MQLATLFHHALEERLFTHFLSDQNKMLQLFSPSRDIVNSEEATKFCVAITNMFEIWKKIKLERTSNVLFCASLQYVQMMNLFLSLKRSICCGDTIAIEDVDIKFLPIFSAAKKNIYIKILLHSIDQYYSVLSKQKLHLLQCNRTARLYDGESKFESVFSEWSQDAVMELLQKYLYNMHIPPI